jgi:predicted DNA-binding ribbon-helix-helix protein
MTRPDNRVDVPIELTDQEWYTLMRRAHDRDITLNQLVQEILAEELKRQEQEQTHDQA